MASKILKILFVGLLFHLFLLGILFYIGVPGFVLSLLRFWKEILLFGLFGGVLLNPKLVRTPRLLNGFDFAVLGLLVIGVIYFLFFSPFAEVMVSEFTEFRIYVYLGVIYWIGRSLNVSEEEVFRIFRTFSLAVLLSGVVGLLNHLFFGHGLISLADNYYASFSLTSQFGQTVTTEDLLNILYTPYSQIRDLNGSYLSLGNTLFFANIFFLASYFYKREKRDLQLFLLGSVIIVLTGARAATGVFVLISLFIIAMNFRRPGLSIALMAFFAIFLMAVPGLSEKFSDVMADITNLEGTAGHMGGWNNFLDAFAERPFGYGFGVGERSAATFGTAQLIGGESNMSHVFGNLGIIGGAAWITMVIFSWTRSVQLKRLSRSSSMSILSFTALSVSIGYFIIALTQYLNDNLEAALPIWFLIGWVGIQSYQLKKTRETAVNVLTPEEGDGALILPRS